MMTLDEERTKKKGTLEEKRMETITDEGEGVPWFFNSGGFLESGGDREPKPKKERSDQKRSRSIWFSRSGRHDTWLDHLDAM